MLARLVKAFRHRGLQHNSDSNKAIEVGANTRVDNAARALRPTVSILDSAYSYTPSHLSDIRVRFDKIRRLQILTDLAAKRAQDADSDRTRRVLDIFEARRK